MILGGYVFIKLIGFEQLCNSSRFSFINLMASVRYSFVLAYVLEIINHDYPLFRSAPPPRCLRCTIRAVSQIIAVPVNILFVPIYCRAAFAKMTMLAKLFFIAKTRRGLL